MNTQPPPGMPPGSGSMPIPPPMSYAQMMYGMLPPPPYNGTPPVPYNGPNDYHSDPSSPLSGYNGYRMMPNGMPYGPMANMTWTNSMGSMPRTDSMHSMPHSAMGSGVDLPSLAYNNSMYSSTDDVTHLHQDPQCEPYSTPPMPDQCQPPSPLQPQQEAPAEGKSKKKKKSKAEKAAAAAETSAEPAPPTLAPAPAPAQSAPPAAVPAKRTASPKKSFPAPAPAEHIAADEPTNMGDGDGDAMEGASDDEEQGGEYEDRKQDEPGNKDRERKQREKYTETYGADFKPTKAWEVLDGVIVCHINQLIFSTAVQSTHHMSRPTYKSALAFSNLEEDPELIANLEQMAAEEKTRLHDQRFSIIKHRNAAHQELRMEAARLAKAKRRLEHDLLVANAKIEKLQTQHQRQIEYIKSVCQRKMEKLARQVSAKQVPLSKDLLHDESSLEMQRYCLEPWDWRPWANKADVSNPKGTQRPSSEVWGPLEGSPSKVTWPGDSKGDGKESPRHDSPAGATALSKVRPQSYTSVDSLSSAASRPSASEDSEKSNVWPEGDQDDVRTYCFEPYDWTPPVINTKTTKSKKVPWSLGIFDAMAGLSAEPETVTETLADGQANFAAAKVEITAMPSPLGAPDADQVMELTGGDEPGGPSDSAIAKHGGEVRTPAISIPSQEPVMSSPSASPPVIGSSPASVVSPLDAHVLDPYSWNHICMSPQSDKRDEVFGVPVQPRNGSPETGTEMMAESKNGTTDTNAVDTTELKNETTYTAESENTEKCSRAVDGSDSPTDHSASTRSSGHQDARGSSGKRGRSV